MAGWWSDKNGPEWVTIVCLVLSLPWWGVVTINASLALFIVSYALESAINLANLFGLSLITSSPCVRHVYIGCHSPTDR